MRFDRVGVDGENLIKPLRGKSTYLDYVNIVLEAERLQQDLVHMGGTVAGLRWRHEAKQKVLRCLGEIANRIR